MRGQVFVPNLWQLKSRITPADAGTSLERPVSLCSIADHPRGCGDKSSTLEAFAGSKGSPPRMRGQVGMH